MSGSSFPLAFVLAALLAAGSGLGWSGCAHGQAAVVPADPPVEVPRPPAAPPPAPPIVRIRHPDGVELGARAVTPVATAQPRPAPAARRIVGGTMPTASTPRPGTTKPRQPGTATTATP